MPKFLKDKYASVRLRIYETLFDLEKIQNG